MKKLFYFSKLSICLLLLASLTSCEDILEQYFPKNPGTPTFPSLGIDIPFYALSGGNKLDSYSTKDPANRLTSVAITGLQGEDRLIAIDFRPATGQLYGLSNSNRLYVLNPKTGVARSTEINSSVTERIIGNIVGFDIEPTTDQVRAITNTGFSLNVHIVTGSGILPDARLTGVPGAVITAVAFGNNAAGASSSPLYAIDAANKKLYQVPNPSTTSGTLVFVGALKLNISGNGSFDIDGKTNTGLGLFDVDGKTTLFTVDVKNGATQTLAQYDKSLDYISIAIPTQPVAYAVSTNNDLVIFNPENPSVAVSKRITGLFTDDKIVAIDFRPSTGQLFALGYSTLTFPNGGYHTNLYVINPATGRSDGSIGFGAFGFALNSEAFGFDFDPVINELRILTTTGQNVRHTIGLSSFRAFLEGSLNPGSPYITAAAYNNNFVGATTTNLYVIDNRTDKLYVQNPPSAGTLMEVGNLGVDIVTANGFDISGNNTAYLTDALNKLYTVDLSTGKATAVGNINISPNAALIGLTVGVGF